MPRALSISDRPHAIAICERQLDNPTLAAPRRNLEAQALIRSVIAGAYADVLQRDPTDVEADRVMNVRLLTLSGALDLMRTLLFTEEFLNRFALTMSPLLLARVLINQVLGRAPRSEHEIAEMATRILGTGWKPAVEHLLSQPDLHNRIVTDMTWRREHIESHSLPEQDRQIETEAFSGTAQAANSNRAAESETSRSLRGMRRERRARAQAADVGGTPSDNGEEKRRRSGTGESVDPIAKPSGRSKRTAARRRPRS